MKIIIKVIWCCCIGLLLVACMEEEERVNCVITYDTLVDARDGKRYAAVSINNQTWMAQNLRYKMEGSLENPSNTAIEYGNLYTYEQAVLACPAGWHLPTDKEWTVLEMALGMSEAEVVKEGWRGKNEGKHLKSRREWIYKKNSSNKVGFRAVPAGRYLGKEYQNFGTQAYFWTASTATEDRVWGRVLNDDKTQIQRLQLSKNTYQSCRCIQD